MMLLFDVSRDQAKQPWTAREEDGFGQVAAGESWGFACGCFSTHTSPTHHPLSELLAALLGSTMGQTLVTFQKWGSKLCKGCL